MPESQPCQVDMNHGGKLDTLAGLILAWALKAVPHQLENTH